MPDLPLSHPQNFLHVPVLAEPLLRTLDSELCDQLKCGHFIDATLGGGGHSSLLLDRYPQLSLTGLDHDETARLAAAERLRHQGNRVTIVATNFADYAPPHPVALVCLVNRSVLSTQSARSVRSVKPAWSAQSVW